MEHKPGGGLDERWAAETHAQIRTHTHKYNDTDTRTYYAHDSFLNYTAGTRSHTDPHTQILSLITTGHSGRGDKRLTS